MITLLRGHFAFVLVLFFGAVLPGLVSAGEVGPRCGRPVSFRTADEPRASDALGILQSTVTDGNPCPGPDGELDQCYCDVNGDGRILAGDALIVLQHAVDITTSPLMCPCVPTCDDNMMNGDESDIDCGGSCEPCPFNAGCLVDDDCQLKNCPSGTCRCPTATFTFFASSNVGGAFDSAEWPGGFEFFNPGHGCDVTILRPSANLELVCSTGDPWAVVAFNGWSSCVGSGGEDGDGCAVTGCPPAGIGSCCEARPSCSAALNGAGSTSFTVTCTQ